MKFFLHKNKVKGFTLIELLVVISIIGLLSSVVLASLNSARVKARDAKRQSDMQQILTALNLYHDTYGCIPNVTGSTCGVAGGGAYSQSNVGGWDYSSQGGGFMTFLQTAGLFPTVPVDPLNTMTGDNNGGYAYRYYCYTGTPPVGLHLGYWSESTGAYVIKNVINSGIWSDNNYVCQ